MQRTKREKQRLRRRDREKQGASKGDGRREGRGMMGKRWGERSTGKMAEKERQRRAEKTHPDIDRARESQRRTDWAEAPWRAHRIGTSL